MFVLPKNNFSLLFWKILFFSKKLLNEKYSKPQCLQKRLYWFLSSDIPLPSKRSCPPTNWFFACTDPVPQAHWIGVTATTRGGRKDDGRRSERLIINFVTIIWHTRYIGCDVGIRQLQANTDPCWIDAGSDRLESDAESEPEEKKWMRTPDEETNSDLKLDVNEHNWP